MSMSLALLYSLLKQSASRSGPFLLTNKSLFLLILGIKGYFSLLIYLVIYEEFLTLGVATDRVFLSGI